MLARLTAALLVTASCSFADGPIKALIITGHNNHNWKYTSRVHQDTLEATGRFAVDVTDTPETTLADAKGLAKYQVFVLDYNDSHEAKRWGDAAEKNFIAAVNGGTGVVSIHSADNAFKGWADYEKMLGLMWREGTGHGKFHAFDTTIVDKDHPITKGMTDIKGTGDELYHKLVNSQSAKYHLLAKAFSTTESGGTGQDEPMAFTLEFGKGRIFATPLGHVWVNSEDTKGSVLNPQFRALICRGTEWAATGAVTLPVTWSDVRTHNTLTDAEKSAGWTLLFDGKSPSSWRGYKQTAFPTKGWTIQDGALWRKPGEEGGDIATNDEYGDFEFSCEWKIAKGGNSGIIYRSTEDHTYSWETGPEMQILDDSSHPDSNKGKTRAGTLYDIIACSADVCRPVGEWNEARILVKGTHVEHWLNGVKVIDTDTASETYKKALAESKWTKYPDYGSRAKGRIVLQDHGDEVSFRNLKIRTIK